MTLTLFLYIKKGYNISYKELTHIDLLVKLRYVLQYVHISVCQVIHEILLSGMFQKICLKDTSCSSSPFPLPHLKWLDL